jgi:hypothetical protein
MANQEKSKLGWFKKYSHIPAWLSALALIPILVWPLINYIFLKGKITINETGIIDIGYYDFGPGIRLQGALSALNKNIFIRNIILSTRNCKNNTTHSFVWDSFISKKEITTSKINYQVTSGLTETTFQDIFPFLVTTYQSFPYYIQFKDISWKNDVNPIILKYRDCWDKKLTEIKGKYFIINDVFNKFSKSDDYLDAEKALDRNYYWEAGEYELKMTVITDDGREFAKNWFFKISKKESDNIRKNIKPILYSCCFPSDPGYYDALYDAMVDYINK